VRLEAVNQRREAVRDALQHDVARRLLVSER
jgi:hypothetical protein